MSQITNGSTFTDSNGDKWLSLSFKRKKENKMDIACAYFHLLSAFNDLKISPAEANFLAHISLNKGVVSGPCKIGYVEKFETSIAAVDNMIGRLKKKKLLLKRGNTVILHPKITLDFNSQNNFVFSFKCIIETNT